jgi:hypothetical protein
VLIASKCLRFPAVEVILVGSLDAHRCYAVCRESRWPNNRCIPNTGEMTKTSVRSEKVLRSPSAIIALPNSSSRGEESPCLGTGVHETGLHLGGIHEAGHRQTTHDRLA